MLTVEDATTFFRCMSRTHHDYNQHSYFRAAALCDDRATRGHHRVLPIDVYNAPSSPHQRNLTHQVSKTVVTILWIYFSFRPYRYRSTPFRGEENAAFGHHDKDIKMANP